MATVIAVPFRSGPSDGSSNIDYWGDGNYRHKLDILTRRRWRSGGAPVLVYIHGGAWVIGDKREQGIPMMHELVQRGWVCVVHQLPAQPQGHLARPHRGLQAGGGLGPGAHRRVRGGPRVHRRLRGIGRRPPVGPAGPDARATEWQPGFEDLDTSVDACLPFYGVYDMTGHPGGRAPTGPDSSTCSSAGS